MQGNERPTGTAMSIPGGLALGGLISLTVTMLLSGIIALLIHRQVLQHRAIGYGVMVLLTTAAFAGAMTAQNRIKHLRLMMCMISGILYWGQLLTITALFFGGQYAAVAETGSMILCGSGLAAFLSAGLEGKGSRIRKNRRMSRHI